MHTPVNHKPEKLIDAVELCDSLLCCRATLYGLIRKGIVPPPIKLGRLSRWPASVVSDITRQHTGS